MRFSFLLAPLLTGLLPGSVALAQGRPVWIVDDRPLGQRRADTDYTNLVTAVRAEPNSILLTWGGPYSGDTRTDLEVLRPVVIVGGDPDAEVCVTGLRLRDWAGLGPDLTVALAGVEVNYGDGCDGLGLRNVCAPGGNFRPNLFLRDVTVRGGADTRIDWFVADASRFLGEGDEYGAATVYGTSGVAFFRSSVLEWRDAFDCFDEHPGLGTLGSGIAFGFSSTFEAVLDSQCGSCPAVLLDGHDGKFLDCVFRGGVSTAGGGTFETLSESPRTVDVPRVVTSYKIPFRFMGTPGDTLFLSVDDRLSPAYQAALKGVNISFPSEEVFDVGVIPPSGELLVSLSLEELGLARPGLRQGSWLYAQAAVQKAGGGFVLTNGTGFLYWTPELLVPDARPGIAPVGR